MTKGEFISYARKTVDEHGQPAMLIPLDVWKVYVEEDKPEEELPQHIRILALLDE